MNAAVLSSWRATKLKFIGRVVAGGTPESGNPNYWDGPVPWLTPVDLGNERNDTITASKRTLTEAGVRAAGLERLPIGSVVFSSRAPIGSVGLLACEAVTNQGCKALVPDSRALVSRFGFYLALNSTETLQSFGLGTTFTELSTYALKNLAVSLPPLPEQRRIAGYLDEATGKVDRLVALRRRQMELLREQRAALIQQAVTRGLNPNAPLKDSSISWLGECPAHWKLIPIKRLLSKVDYGTSEATTATGSIRVLTMGNIQNGEITVPDSGGLDAVPDSLLLENNDLLFTRTNGNPDLVGKVGIFRGNISDRVSFASYLVRLRVNRRHKSEWLHLLLNSTAFWPFARRHALINLQTNLNSTRYVQFPIPVPPPEEQQEIISYIQRQMAKLDALSRSCERQIELLTEYRAALIHECVTGQRAVPQN